MSIGERAPATVSQLSAQEGDQQKFYYPPQELVERSNIMAYVREKGFKTVDELYLWTIQQPEQFWSEMASRFIEWFEPWQQVLDESQAPFYKWFVGGKLNAAHNAVERHANGPNRDKLAYIWESEQGETRRITYGELAAEVNRFANVLRSQGVKKGDRVTIYLSRVPELPIAMLACAKIGAMHSVVYGGFSTEALYNRIMDAQSRVLITGDGGYMNGKIVELKRITDEAVDRAHDVVETVIVLRRTGHDVPMKEGRDKWWHELAAQPGMDAPCPTEVMDAEDPLYMLYTSGTTGAPKGLVHTTGGYLTQVATTLSFVFDIKPDDIYWCAADPGWVTGHSYIVYGPLMLGATGVMYEGAPSYPNPGRWWEIVQKYGVTILYTAPTAIRGLMRFGEEWPNKYDLSSLRLLGSVGEPINPEAWRWYYRVIGKNRCPIMDTWWQTETGAFMITPNPTTPLKPGSATKPFLGIEADVLTEEGKPAGAEDDGLLVIKRPWPSMLRTIYGDPQRYIDQYWSRIPGFYTAGDAARKDEDGYFWVIGRIDDVLKVSGYRLGTAELESALVSHPAVAEAAVIGLPHEVKGNAIHAYVLLRQGYEGSDQLAEELRQHVAKEMGPIARPEAINFVTSLPKTRSGKIMRRVLKARALGLPEGDLSTLEG
ncbi:acetate--CoA ligase [Kallotenue papyrolyticum]|uniref:acetate--CoA ligase n=1 Tax=Kallotenue papyrolyticum TaxID=1325125 RepID=UPI00049236CA|nr:acetate--CoA ligase [Kallotenue papyrolyticum]